MLAGKELVIQILCKIIPKDTRYLC